MTDRYHILGTMQKPYSQYRTQSNTRGNRNAGWYFQEHRKHGNRCIEVGAEGTLSQLRNPASVGIRHSCFFLSWCPVLYRILKRQIPRPSLENQGKATYCKQIASMCGSISLPSNRAECNRSSNSTTVSSCGVCTRRIPGTPSSPCGASDTSTMYPSNSSRFVCGPARTKLIRHIFFVVNVCLPQGEIKVNAFVSCNLLALLPGAAFAFRIQYGWHYGKKSP